MQTPLVCHLTSPNWSWHWHSTQFQDIWATNQFYILCIYLTEQLDALCWALYWSHPTRQHKTIIFITESLYLLYINVLMLLHLAFVEAKVIQSNVSSQISLLFTRQRRKYGNNKVYRKDVVALKTCYFLYILCAMKDL